MRLYVGNIKFDVGDRELRDVFERFGKVESAQVVIDKDSQQSRGFGFVEIDEAGGRRAIAEMDQTQHQGR